MSDQNWDAQVLIEKKLYLAKQCPEPIFDLSSCSLKKIPKGIFSVIKVLRKKSLYLQDNKLVSLKEGGNIVDLFLLKVLDLSSNNILKLPSDIKYLVNLQVLRIDNNELTQLPNEIGCITSLRILSISTNKLSILPSTIDKLDRLQRLDIRQNHKLNSLPSTICRLKQLEELLLDDENEWISPPTVIVKQQSVHSILSYFTDNTTEKSFEIGGDIDTEAIDQLKVCHRASETSTSGIHNTDVLQKLLKYDQLVQDNLRRLEKEKGKKFLHQLNIEKNIIAEKEKQAILRTRSQRHTKQFLDTLAAEQRKIDEQVSKCHQMKNEERNEMLKQLLLVESTADSVIAQLIEINRVQKRDYLALILASMKSDESVQHLHRQTVLESMQQLLAEEYRLVKKLEQNDDYKLKVIQLSNEQEMRIHDKISSLLQKRENDKNSLIEVLKRDSELQCTAVLMLIERSDRNNVELRNQISLIENQLSNITALELQNKNANANRHINELTERRSMLTVLLEDILARQQCYRQKLTEELVQMEKRHSPNEREEYWLLKYQKLLETSGGVISNSTINLSPTLIYQLALHGMSHYAPLLSMLDTASVDTLSAIDDRSLQSVGISSSEDRLTILKTLKQFVWDQINAQGYITKPTAPPLELINNVIPSAPSEKDIFDGKKSRIIGAVSGLNDFLENECVICMSMRSNIVFICCGHICCCCDCSAKVMECPLCRCDIERKIQIFNA